MLATIRSRTPGSRMGISTSTRRWKIARHPVGARRVHLFVSAVVEAKDALVLEEAVDDRKDLDPLGEAGDARAQAADAADRELDLHAGLRGHVERVDHVHVDEGVHLGDDLALAAGARVADLPRYQAEDGLVEAERRDDEAVPLQKERCSR